MRREDSHGGALICLVLLGLLVIMPIPVAFAHKVNIFAYAQGDMVYTESYFPDGKKIEGGLIEVYDSQGNKLLEGKTDKDGRFNFKPPIDTNLKIVLTASMGHKNSYTLQSDELPPAITAQKSPEPEFREPGGKEIAPVELDQIKRVIDSSLDQKLKPVMKELKRAQQKEAPFTEVIGGIGYILGIMGIILYFLSRNKER